MVLNPKQHAFVTKYLELGCGAKAAVAAGYAPGSAHVTASRLLRRAKVLQELQERRAEIERRAAVDRDRVIRELLETIELAKLQGDVMAMIAGWREIAKMMGYYERRTKVEVKVEARGDAIRLKAMSDEELMALAEERA